MFALVIKNKNIYDKKIEDKFKKKLKNAYIISENRRKLYKVKLSEIIEKAQTYDENYLDDLLKNI